MAAALFGTELGARIRRSVERNLELRLHHRLRIAAKAPTTSDGGEGSGNWCWRGRIRRYSG